MLDPADASLDCPIAGVGLFGLAAWGLLRRGTSAGDGVHLLALADRFAYNRSIPTMAWEPLAAVAEQRLPGRLSTVIESYGTRPPRDLVGEARELVAQL
jgi:hypothetical protein